MIPSVIFVGNPTGDDQSNCKSGVKYFIYQKKNLVNDLYVDTFIKNTPKLTKLNLLTLYTTLHATYVYIYLSDKLSNNTSPE